MAFLYSNTPLGGNGTVTLGPIQTDLADRITGTVFANVNGTLFIEQSSDGGANFDVSTSIAVVGGTGQGFSQELYAPFVRLRYVNGAGAQATFRLYSRFSSAGAR